MLCGDANGKQQLIDSHKQMWQGYAWLAFNKITISYV